MVWFHDQYTSDTQSPRLAKRKNWGVLQEPGLRVTDHEPLVPSMA